VPSLPGYQPSLAHEFSRHRVHWCHRLPLRLAPVKQRHDLPALVGLAFVALAAGGCGSTAGTTATVTETVRAAPITATVTQTVAATPAASPRRPVTLSGSGVGVHTADLSAGGYTATWSATESPGGFTAVPVNADGSLDYSPGRTIMSMDTTGTLAFQATGPTTFQIGGAGGPWTLTFTPLG
jgi:hypothetical protein